MSNAAAQPGPVTPLTELADGSGLVLLGGSFDPPHAWHTAIARAARDALFGPDGWIVFIPAAQSPLKSSPPIASPVDRVAMLRLAVADTPHAIVWTDEIDRAGGTPTRPSYTIETVERLRTILPHRPLRLLMGMDQAEQFHRWHRFRDLMELAEPAIVYRGQTHDRERVRAALAATGAWTNAELDEWDRRLVPCNVSAVSSTRVRQMLADPKADPEARAIDGLIQRSVLEYIRDKGLYARPAV